MEIINLPAGEPAAAEVDCLRIEEQEDGRFQLAGNALAPCGDDGELESVGIIIGEPYDSFEAAEAAGLAWADELGVEQLHVSRSDGPIPLPDPK